MSILNDLKRLQIGQNILRKNMYTNKIPMPSSVGPEATLSQLLDSVVFMVVHLRDGAHSEAELALSRPTLLQETIYLMLSAEKLAGTDSDAHLKEINLAASVARSI